MGETLTGLFSWGLRNLLSLFGTTPEAVAEWLDPFGYDLDDEYDEENPRQPPTATATLTPPPMNTGATPPPPMNTGAPLPPIGSSGPPLPKGPPGLNAGSKPAVTATSPAPLTPPVATAPQATPATVSSHIRSGAQLKAALTQRQDDRAQLQAPVADVADNLKLVTGGEALVTALDTLRGVPPAAKNAADTLGKLDGVLKGCDDWLANAKTAAPPPAGDLIKRIEATRAAAEREQKSLTDIRAAVANLSTADKDFATTGEWNISGGARIKSVSNMGHGPSDKDSEARKKDSERQIKKFLAILDKEVSRSDAFAALATDSMRVDGGSFDLFFGKGTAGAFDDYHSLGVDVDDLESLPDDPQSVSGTNAGVTKGEIVAHVLEERMYGYQAVGGQTTPYNIAHQKCLSPGSYQNQHRREIGIPADSIFYDNCKHSHTSNGCACFEATDTQGMKTIVHDIPTDLKAGKPLAELTSVTPPPASATEVVQSYPGTEKQNLEALVSKALTLAKTTMQKQAKEKSTKVADPFSWKNVSSQDLLHFITIAEGGDSAAIDQRKQAVFDELEKYRKSVDDGATLSADLEVAKSKADQWRVLGNSPEEAQLATERGKRPPAINVGSAADGATNCALCTIGAITNTTTEQFSKSLQEKFGRTPPDTTMQGPSLFMNAALGMTDKTPAGDRQAKLQTMPPEYIDEVTKRYKLDSKLPDYWQTLEKMIEGDFQFEGIRTTLQSGVDDRNKTSATQYEVVQDGLPDEEDVGGKMYAWPELVKRMEVFPDGSQFQVFVDGDLQHWIYADKVRGKVIFEDLQKNVKIEKEKPNIPAVPRGWPDAKKKFPDEWAEAEAEIESTLGRAPEGPTEQVQIRTKMIANMSEKMPPTPVEYTVPNSAYLIDGDTKPSHPQKDENKDAFKRGMYFAIVPKNAAKPADCFEKQIKPAHDKLNP